MLWHKLIAFAVLSLVLCQLHQVTSDDANPGCRTNFSRVGDKCLLIVEERDGWYEADRNCRALGAGLLSLQNPIQLLELNQWLNNSGQPFAKDYWTSGNNLGNQYRTFFWQSTGKEATYIPWAAGQPIHIDNCLLIESSEIFNANYRLSVTLCSMVISSVCEHAPLNYTLSNVTRICLKPDSFETVQVLVN
ncbi:uncharacterized protein LOC133842377 [Drosophila sulfurigaster albostrigata]|uniref:uncharacterized protein LOC133842377 n=1 Tax=Drosophila sulfurigaster albostrigata TaxID=89887 RepID=UPI002D218952|nr:uncharacterized protein LOC133842377 [Drosophila sulfurigaster albostrigata]